MAFIAPTITTADPAEFQKQIQESRQLSRRLQVDVSDGTFAPTTLVPLDQIQFPPDSQIDLHLMTAKPSQYVNRILELKPSLCIMHVESDDDLASVATQLHSQGIKIGYALLKGTFPGKYRDLLATANHIMIFAGALGQQGGAIDMLQTEKIPLIKAINAAAEIGWDGGANLSNVRALARAGVDVINVGSALSQASDKPAMFQSLITECDKKGVLI